MDGARNPHRPMYDRYGGHACATFNLVVPLAELATDMRSTDTAGRCRARSGAVSRLIGMRLRSSDVDSTMRRSTRRTPTTPGSRTSTMATRITTTRIAVTELVPSADYSGASHADFSFEELVTAYFDCRQHKRNTLSALAFEQDLERNLCRLRDELLDGSYAPGRSVCFVITRPKPREVWAADFRDRVVHHLLYNRIAPRFHASFIADSCACIPGRGTLYAARRLEAKIRSITENWSTPAWYLKCDLANFFVSINKPVLWRQICARVTEPWWQKLAGIILFHDPRKEFEFHGDPAMLRLVPPHKQLINQVESRGLPIGNLSSQFFANVYLNALDQHAKHRLRVRHYVRYVDDFILLHKSPQTLNAALTDIAAFLQAELDVSLNPKKTILQPVDRGVDFVGHVIKPWTTRTRPRTVKAAIRRIEQADTADVHTSANSYFGLLGQPSSSHTDRAKLARAVMRRGHCVDLGFTKSFRRKNEHR